MESPIKTPRRKWQMESPKTPKRKRQDDTITEKSMQYFELINDDEKTNSEEFFIKKIKTHKCKLCKFDFNGMNRWNLACHLSSKHPRIYYELSCCKKEPIQVTRLRLLQHCTEIVTVNGRPFTSLLDSGFQSIIRKTSNELDAENCGLNLSQKNLDSVKNHVNQTAEKVRQKIREEVAHRPLSLLADIVTKHKRSILGVSVQYFFNGELKVRSIGFIQLSERHTGKYLAEVVITRLKDYGIDLKQIITITTDNGKNILKMVRDMTSHLLNEINAKESHENRLPSSNFGLHDNERTDIEIGEVLAHAREITDDEALEAIYEEVATLESNDTLLKAMTNEMVQNYDANFLWDITGVNCVEHTLQLGVKDGLNMLGTSQKNVIELCREVAKLLRSDSTCNETGKLGIQYRLPRLESNTRWGSMYLMLFDVLECEHVIKHYAVSENSKIFQLLLKKWAVLKELVVLLRSPYNATIAFQNQRLTLSDTYGKWLGMQLFLEVCTSKASFKTGLAKHLLTALKNRNEKIFNNPLMSCALYLDPRFHFQFIKCTEKTEQAKENLLKIWRRLNILRGDAVIEEGESSIKSNDSLNFDFDEGAALAAHLQNKSVTKQATVQGNYDDIEYLIENYQPDELDLNTSILAYWELKKDELKELYQLGTVIFSVPPTEVQIERDFSALDFIFTKRRGNLSAFMLENIFVLHLNKDLFYKVNEEDINLLFSELENRN